METEPAVCDVVALIAELAFALGVCPLNAHPRPWVHRVDDHWTIAANAQKATMRVEPHGCMEAELPPFHMAVWWNGWLAGILAPDGGPIAAHPEGANEDRLIADLKAAIRKERR